MIIKENIKYKLFIFLNQEIPFAILKKNNKEIYEFRLKKYKLLCIKNTYQDYIDIANKYIKNYKYDN